MNTQNLSHASSIVLRLGLAAVFLWFGFSQLLNTQMWLGLVPGWATGLSRLDASTIVSMNGIFEIITGSMLAMGVYVRLVALVLAVHVSVITLHLGLGPIGVRDFGLALATCALALRGDDVWCIARTRKNSNQ